ncbi:MAG: hypothetical protein M1828_007443 [Chrysothrix sp. TS-e1954]|nr:MAG: hypothetical protein M1828_007443 [Chrysothrix sp. TS-e1954]
MASDGIDVEQNTQRLENCHLDKCPNNPVPFEVRSPTKIICPIKKPTEDRLLKLPAELRLQIFFEALHTTIITNLPDLSPPAFRFFQVPLDTDHLRLNYEAFVRLFVNMANAYSERPQLAEISTALTRIDRLLFKKCEEAILAHNCYDRSKVIPLAISKRIVDLAYDRQPLPTYRLTVLLLTTQEQALSRWCLNLERRFFQIRSIHDSLCCELAASPEEIRERQTAAAEMEQHFTHLMKWNQNDPIWAKLGIRRKKVRSRPQPWIMRGVM